jgi:nucleotide-binding universal stress UspA family protein
MTVDVDHPTRTRPEPAEPLGELRYNRLLVAVDGSRGAELALSAAVTVAKRDRATLTLISVSPDVSRWPSGAAYDPNLQHDADEDAQRLLREAVDRIPADIGVKTLFRRGQPGPEIAKVAACGEYDALMVGARGVGRVGALFGSVSSYLLHHVEDVPVFVAHAPKAQED